MIALPRFGDSLKAGLLYYYLTSLPVALGLILGASFLRELEPLGYLSDYRGHRFTNWDGQWYVEIVKHGYSYDKYEASSVAFFPAYPLAGRLLSRSTGLPPEYALVLVSNAFLAMAFITFHRYVSLRYESPPPGLAENAVLALGLVPTTFFFRMAYSESLFLLITATVFLGMERRWPSAAVAALVGLGTATRPVGVGLVPVLLFDLWRRSPRTGAFLRKAAYLGPLSCWGIAAYAAYLSVHVGEPFAFSTTQAYWRERPTVPMGEKLVALATFEPIRRLFDPAHEAYWDAYEPNHFPAFSLHVADPILFLTALGLVALGSAKRWLSAREAIAGAFFLLIPYSTSGYETFMRSMGRYSSAALPVYLTLAHLMCLAPQPLVSALAATSGFLLGVYTAMFAAWYKFV